MQARRQQSEIFKVLSGKNHQPRILYLVKLSFKNEGKIKAFSDKQKWRKFVAGRSDLQKMLSSSERSKIT